MSLKVKQKATVRVSRKFRFGCFQKVGLSTRHCENFNDDVDCHCLRDFSFCHSDVRLHLPFGDAGDKIERGYIRLFNYSLLLLLLLRPKAAYTNINTTHTQK